MCFLTAWHIYLTILIHWNIYSFIYLPIATWGGCGWNWTNRGWKKNNSRYFSFLKKICQMENLPLRIFSYESMFSTIFTHWPISVIGRRCDKSSVSIGTIVAPSKRRIVFCPISFPPPVPDTNFRGVMFKESSSFANVLCLEFAILEINDTNPNFIQTPGVLVDNDMVKVQA